MSRFNTTTTRNPMFAPEDPKNNLRLALYYDDIGQTVAISSCKMC